MCDILWSDPAADQVELWKDSERGVSFTYNSSVVDEFCRKNDIDLICRAHMVVEAGYEFFANK